MIHQVNLIELGVTTLNTAELTINGGCDCWGPIAIGGAINPETGETIAVLYGPLCGPRQPHPVITLPGTVRGN